MSTISDEVFAHVSPRSIGGESLFSTKRNITKNNAKEFHSDESDIENSKRGLREAGFTVYDEGSSKSTIAIGGSSKLFKEFFGAKLKKQQSEIAPGITQSFYGTDPDQPEVVLDAPGELSNLIEGATIARPPEYYGVSALPPIAPVHPDAYRYLSVPDDVAVLLRAARVHRLGVTGKNVNVAMIDTGQYRHPFFTGHGFLVSNTILGPGASDPSDDMNGHGTGESANVFACAPDCKLQPIKMASDTVGAINAAMNANTPPQIITNSWGYNVDFEGRTLPSWLRPLEAAVANAVANGVVVCFAAGNGHRAFPGSHPDVISVGGVHVNYPDLTFEASSYASSFESSFYPGRRVPDLCGLTGKRVDINGGKAPSLMLPVQEDAALDTIDPQTSSGADGWGIFSGTSAACPQVAGICALILEKDPSLTPDEVKEKLIKGARDITAGSSAMGDAAGVGNDLATGAGLADAKWSYLNTMGDVVAKFFSASKDEQSMMLESGHMPEVSKDFIDNMINTLRSR